MSDPIAILSSMDQEIRMVEERLEDTSVRELHRQRFVSGKLHGTEVVTAISGYGKTAAAATASCAIYEYGARAIIFGGVAGGIRPDVEIGDIVVADTLIHHDLDASPLFEPYVVPSLGIAEIPADPDLTDQLVLAAEHYVQEIAPHEMTDVPVDQFEVSRMSVRRGLVSSGDRFVNNLAEAATLLGRLPGVLAVEMEGASVAQVCAERGVPFAVFRSISDRADEDAEIDFLAYVSSVAAPVTAGVVSEWIKRVG
jgi:adenosylhomocysteine nucleosidase